MAERSVIGDFLGLGCSLALCFAVAGAGSLATFDGLRAWYPALAKPSFNPPNWIFGPVWSTLYTVMAIAAWLVWRKAGAIGGKWPLCLFALQLALNLAWSILFFGLRAPGLAFAEVLALWLAILATLIAFRPVSVPAALLMVPYLAWVTFAALLNFAIWRLNA